MIQETLTFTGILQMIYNLSIGFFNYILQEQQKEITTKQIKLSYPNDKRIKKFRKLWAAKTVHILLKKENNLDLLSDVRQWKSMC